MPIGNATGAPSVRRPAPPTGAVAAMVVGLALTVVALVAPIVDLTTGEYGAPILPPWLGVLGLLPCVAGVVTVVLLWRRPDAARRAV